MSAHELGSGMYHDISTMLQRTKQIRSSEGAVYDERNAMSVSDFSNGLQINYIRIRVAKGLCVEELGIRLNGFLKVFRVGRIYQSGSNALLRQSILKQVGSSAVQVGGRYNMISCLRDVLDCVSNGCRTRCGCQCTNAAL